MKLLKDIHKSLKMLVPNGNNCEVNRQPRESKTMKVWIIVSSIMHFPCITENKNKLKECN